MKKYFISVCLLLTGCGVLFDDPLTRFWNGGYFLFPDKETASDGIYKTSDTDLSYYESLTVEQRKRYLKFKPIKDKCEHQYSDRTKYDYATQIANIVKCFNEHGYQSETAFILDGYKITQKGDICTKDEPKNCDYHMYSYTVLF
ncbi:MAG: hypothetical protein IIU35_01780 [Neisseriaceae bacterium]|nr:hypothetical protein [Neisseriaceae bacterium]